MLKVFDLAIEAANDVDRVEGEKRFACADLIREDGTLYRRYWAGGELAETGVEEADDDYISIVAMIR